jgi:hypothetical protein
MSEFTREEPVRPTSNPLVAGSNPAGRAREHAGQWTDPSLRAPASRACDIAVYAG